MRRSSAAAVVLVLCASFLGLSAFSGRVAADPWTIDNLDGSSDAVWNFTTPADYALSGTRIVGGIASLARQTGWWNSTTLSDFSGPDGATNVTWTSWPGDVGLSLTSGPPTLLTLQPGAAGEDTWLDRTNPGTNHGGDTTLVLDGRNPESRPILRFDLSSLPANVLIDNATLSLYQNTGVGNNVNGRLRLVTASWVEAQATWDDRSAGTPWGSAGGDYNGKIVDQRALDNTVGWRTWNATVLVDLWHRGRLANYGLILEAPNPGGNADKTFFSSDYNVDPTLRPKLEIWYRSLGVLGEYISKVGTVGGPTNWETISWNVTDRSLVTDEFDGGSLDPRWTWTNPPPAYDVGTTTPGSLHVVSSTAVEIFGPFFTGNVLANEVVGNFTATMKFTTNPTASGQKAGLMALLGPRDWYNVGKQFVGATSTVNWRVRSTVDSATTTRVDVDSGNPNPAWVRIQRAGNTFTASTSTDGTAWTLRDTYSPTFEYPLEIRLAFYTADGFSGTALSTDVDYIRVVHDTDATATVQTRTGDVTPVDGTWTGWSTPYPSPAGSAMSGSSAYIEFRLAMALTYPDHTPDIADVNLSGYAYPAGGALETGDLVPGDVSEWGDFTVLHALNGQTIAYEYSTDSGGSWASVSPPASLQSVPAASGKIRFRATFSTASPLVTPTLSEMRLSYRHTLDHFHITADSTATAGAPFTLTITAKDTGNFTMTGWTGSVTLEPMLSDGVTPGGGVLGTASVSITTGGAVSLGTETYTKAEVIRIRGSAGAASGLSGPIDISPNTLDHVTIVPGDVTILPFDSQVLSAQGYDAWNNAIAALTYTWSVTGGVGSLNASSGSSVNFTASPPPANGTVEATAGTVVGVAQIHVVSGILPWVAISAPTSGAHLTGVGSIGYTNSSNAVSLTFEYDGGAGWTLIGTTAALNGTFLWNTTGLDFSGGSLRAVVTSDRAATNTTIVTPIEVDNTAPTIAVGPAADSQATSGTITLTYATPADVVQVDFEYFDGTWNAIGSDGTVDGSYVWTPGVPINGVTVRATATDEVGLRGSGERPGIGSRTLGPNPPSVLAIPTLHVRTGVPYALNLTFYVTDADTPLASLTITVADPGNVTVAGGPYPGLSITYGTAGTYVVTLWVSDGTDTAWALLTIIASGANPPVVVAAPPDVAFDEDTTVVDGFGTPATAFFIDSDGDLLVYTVLGNRSVRLRVNAGGTLDFWADPNWFGTEAMRLRATDPTGGFAEVAFMVLVRPVNDGPAIATIPDLSVEAGTVYVLDLRAYLSDVDTPVSSLIVTTDSPYVTVDGHNLTLAFPPDWTNAEIRITVSDGSAVSLTTARIAFYVIPAWWSSPFVLALPPIGAFVVVAMFAQRARWRPAKAFLVDERDRMIREFTLDPSCRLTYDEAVQAGALAAVEKPIKVAKYHAQTVRGDALGVVLLAYGPVTLEQVEFAREMLVQIQDKFEDSVKTRLAEARTYEGELANRAKEIEERQATSEARAAELESITRQVEGAQAKLSTDAQTLDAQAKSLVDREGRLSEDRTAVDRLARQLEELRVSLDRRSAEIQEQEAGISQRTESLDARETAVAPTEEALSRRDAALLEGEAGLKTRIELAERTAADLAAQATALEGREGVVAQAEDRLAAARRTFEEEQKELLAFRASIDSRVGEVEAAEAGIASKRQELEAREARLAPAEKALLERASALDEREANIQAEVARRSKHLEELEGRLAQETDVLRTREGELTDGLRSIESRSQAIAVDRAALDEARTTLEGQRSSFEDQARSADAELRKRKEDLDSQARGVGEAQLHLSQERQEFEEVKAERSHWIASKEIELESREQAVAEKEAAIRSQAEQNAQRLTDLAAREETLEVERDRLEKDRTELAGRKAELDKLAKGLDARATTLRDEEARKAEEHRTWQATLESEQGLLRQQRETFEKEIGELRDSWAGRMARLQEREEDTNAREEKLRGEAERVGRMDEVLTRRETEVQTAVTESDRQRADLESARKELEQRAFELDARERSLREEAARHTDELTRRDAALRASEAKMIEKEAEADRLLTARTLTVQQAEADLGRKVQSHDAKVAELTAQDARLGSLRESLQQEQERLVRERTDLQAATEQLDARQVELAQQRQRHGEESARYEAEVDSIRQSLAAKEADLHAERERLERESTSLQDRLGSKAQELVSRERSIAAQEEELRAEEQDLEGRIRAIDSRERQIEAHAAEVAAQATALANRQAEVDARAAQLEATALRFATEQAQKQKEWESLRTALESQEAQLNASAESRKADLSKRLSELEARERSHAATATQLEAEKARLADAAKAQTAKDAEATASMARAEKRFQELKARESEILELRQDFESEKSTWAGRRATELKQLEATRDATAEQMQKAERLMQEAQRRALLANEAERAAKRQADDVAAFREDLEKRRTEVERLERTLQAQDSQFQETSRKLAVKEAEIGGRERDLQAAQARVTATQQELVSSTEALKARQAGLDREAARLAQFAAEVDGRKADAQSRASAAEARMVEVVERERVLTTELQRAENLMEDLGRKDEQIRSKEKVLASAEADLAKRNAAAAAKEAELREGKQSLDGMRREVETRLAAIEQDRSSASAAREEAFAQKAEADRAKAEAEAMEKEVSKNMKFLQKKAVDVLDREERVREKDQTLQEREKALEVRSEILESKERELEADRGEFLTKMERLQAEVDRLKARLSEAQQAAKPSAEMEDWKKEIDNRVKIIQRKAVDLLDREEKLRKKEEELHSLAQQLGVKP